MKNLCYGNLIYNIDIFNNIFKVLIYFLFVNEILCY